MKISHSKYPSLKRTLAASALLFGTAFGFAACTSSDASAQSNNIPAAYTDPAEPALPQISMEVTQGDTALVIIDPQVDFLHPEGVTWGVIGASVTEHNTVENIGKLFAAAKSKNMEVFVSPHHYYPTDHGWSFEGPLEKLMHSIGMFDRKSPYSLDGFDKSGSDFMEQYKPHIHDGKTVITSPHKVYGPRTNDLTLQLRKRGINKVILGGMSANLCVQAHLYDLLEEGFEVSVVRDATAAAKLPEGDGYQAALINFRYVANDLVTTEEAVKSIKKAQ